jgi:hypothetical protein
MRQDDSGAPLQRIRRLLVQVRDGTRVFEHVVAHDQFGIGKHYCLDSEDVGTTRGELSAGRTREVGVQKRANVLDVVPLPRAIGLILTSGHGDALRSLPHRARAAFRAAALRCFLDRFFARFFPPFRPVAWNIASTSGGSCTGFRLRATVSDRSTGLGVRAIASTLRCSHSLTRLLPVGYAPPHW